MLLQLSVDGLREPGLGETQNFRALQREEILHVRLGVMLHHRIVRVVLQDLLATVLRNISRDENEVQVALAAHQGVAAHDQRAGLQHEWEQSLDGLDWCFIAHATFTLIL